MPAYRIFLITGLWACIAATAADAQQPYPPAPPAQPAPQYAPPPCAGCGTIDSIHVVEMPGEASGGGMIVGGLLGGLIGHQVGSGRGNTAATIVGAAGGAYAGHQVEKNMHKRMRYDVNVRMDDGTWHMFNYDVEPGFRTGDRVRWADGRLLRL